MKKILSDITMGGLFLLMLISAQSAFSASSMAAADQKIISHKLHTSALTSSKLQKSTPSSLPKKFPENASLFEAVAMPATSGIKSYKQWKSDQIQAAIHRVVAAKIIIQKAPVPRAHQQLAVEQLGLNAAKSLTLKDYIAMYLGTQANRQLAMAEGAKLLSPDEVQTVLEELATPARR